MTKQSFSTLRTAQAVIAAACALISAPAFAAQTVKTSDILAPYLKMHSFKGIIKTTTSITPLKGGSGATNVYGTIKVEYQSPNKSHAETEGMMGSMKMVCDGKTMYFYSAMTNTWWSSPAPQSQMSLITQDLGNVGSLNLTGHKTIAGQPCDVYVGKNNSQFGTGTVAIAIGAQDHLIHKVFTTLPSMGMPQGGKLRMTVEEDFQTQQVNASIPASEFRFSPPAGSQKAAHANMPSIMGGMSGSMR